MPDVSRLSINFAYLVRSRFGCTSLCLFVCLLVCLFVCLLCLMLYLILYFQTSAKLEPGKVIKTSLDETEVNLLCQYTYIQQNGHSALVRASHSFLTTKLLSFYLCGQDEQGSNVRHDYSLVVDPNEEWRAVPASIQQNTPFHPRIYN